METADVGGVKSARGCGVGGQVGGWVRGSDGRQTCGVEVVIVVLMVFRQGRGRVGVRALHRTSVSLMTPQCDYLGWSTQLHKPPLRFGC